MLNQGMTAMTRILLQLLILVGMTLSAAAEPPKPLVTGLEHPTAVTVGAGGKIYVTVIGTAGKDGDGAVMLIDNGRASLFAKGLDDPTGIAAFQNWLFVADKQRVWKIDAKGKADVFAPASAFPGQPKSLDDITVDPETGLCYVCGTDADGKGVVYRVTPRGAVSIVLDATRLPGMWLPTGLRLDGSSNLLFAAYGDGELRRVKLSDGSTELLAKDLNTPGGVAWDHYGRLFVSDRHGNRIWAIPRAGSPPVAMPTEIQSPEKICLDPTGNNLLVVKGHEGTLTSVPISIPGHEVDTTPLPLQTEVAFPDLKWTGWKGETEAASSCRFGRWC